MTDLYRPKEARDRLDVSESTLRRWCAEFADWLSPSARAAITETGGVAQRMFSEADLALLAGIKLALADRQSSEEVRRRLAAGEPLPTPPPPRNPATEPPVGGSADAWRANGGSDDGSGVVADRNNAALLPLTAHPLYLMLEDLRDVMAAAEAQQAQRHAELLAKQQELIDVTREQTAAQRELAAALQAQQALGPASPVQESGPGAVAWLRRWWRGSG